MTTSNNSINKIRKINFLWVLLIALTLFSVFFAESETQTLSSVCILAIVLAIKGRIVVDYFMELKHSNKVLRALMRLYFIVIPSLIIVVYLYPETLASWTKL